MATYNGEKYLEEQLQSIINQTYTNTHIIIQDDSSTDDTIKILNKYEKEYDNFTLFQNSTNLGYIKNFESLLKKADGDYIAICDQDDIWELDKLEILMNELDTNMMVYSDSLLVDADGVSLNKTLSEKLKNNFIDSESTLNFLYDNSVSAHAMLFDKKLLESIFPFPQHIYFDAWIAANAANNGTIKFVNKPLVNYRQHASNTLGNIQKKSTTVVSKVNKKVQKKEQDVENTLLKIKVVFKIPCQHRIIPKIVS